jgi:cardiolipin synthase A/B
MNSKTVHNSKSWILTLHKVMFRRSSLAFLWPLLGLLFLAGCTTGFPDVSTLERPATDSRPDIMGPRGKLRPDRAETVLSGKAAGPSAEDLVRNTVTLLASLTKKPLTAGNRITLLVDGRETYDAMKEAIATATDHVNVEMYMFSGDEVGQDFADLLIRKQREGVQINLLYDAVGSSDTPAAFFQNMQINGVNVMEFNPIDPAKVRKQFRLVQRDHRKVIVVDGKIGFAGGVNISNVYSSSSSRPVKGDVPEGWRDTDVKIEGPAVAELQDLFIGAWRHQNGPPLPAKDYFPRIEVAGNSLVEVIGSWRGENNRPTYVLYVSVFEHAYRSIHLTTPYFVPDRQMKRAISRAAKRGVDVTMVLPGLSDSSLAFDAGRSHYEDLLEAGVRIFERTGRMVHAKTATIDGFLSTVGSTNMDAWSSLRNNEINVIVVDPHVASEVEQLFETDVAASHEITREEWAHRPLLQRVRQRFARLFSYWL